MSVLAVGLSACTYYLIENPIRHNKWLAHSPAATLIGAAFLIASCVAFTYAF